MSQAATRLQISIAEYLRRERDSVEKHEFVDGQIILMAGGSEYHSLICLNVGGEIRQRLKGKPCRAYDSDLRVRIPGTSFLTYPDVSVICGPSSLDPDDPRGETVTNPRLIVEVLSPSTESYDRGKKFDRYRMLESLREYVLVAQDIPRIDAYFRQGDGTWLFSPTVDLTGVARLRSLEIDLPLAEVYANVEFPTLAEDKKPA